MDQRWPTCYCEVDGHVGGACVHHHPPVCSGETVKRKVEDADGHWAVRGADILDQFIQYYSTHSKTAAGTEPCCYTSWRLRQEKHSSCTVRRSVPCRCCPWHTKILWRSWCVSMETGIPHSRRAEQIRVPIVTDKAAVQKGTKGRRLFIHRLEVDSKRSDTPRKYQDWCAPLSCGGQELIFVEASYCNTWLFYYEYCCYCCFLRVWFYISLY